MNVNRLPFDYFGLVILKKMSTNFECFGKAYDVNATRCIKCSVANDCKKESVSKKGDKNYE